MNQSERTNTPTQHDQVYALVASSNFAHDGCCYAGRASGMYISPDTGKTWVPMYDSLGLTTPLSTLSVAIADEGEAQQTIFAGVAEGVLRSSDLGKRWQRSLFPAPPPIVAALAISPNFSDDGLVLAATLEEGIYRSSDRGQHWASANFGLLDLNVLALLISPNFNQDEMVFAATSSGIFRSTNAGLAWRETGFPPEDAPILSLAYFLGVEGAEKSLYAGTETSGLFVSHDDATTWMPIAEGKFTEPINCLLVPYTQLPENRLLVATGVQLQLTQDGGRNWFNLSRDLKMDEGISAICAPGELEPSKPILVGGLNGEIRVITL